MTNEEKAKKWAKVVAQAWADEDFKKRLIADPAAVLQEQGGEIPAGVTLKIIEDTATTKHLILPVMPKNVSGGELLEERAAAFCHF